MLTVQYCDFVHYDAVGEYRQHFLSEYCLTPLETFDSNTVTFRPEDFGHAFFKGDFVRDRFSWPRAERIDWIAKALRDPAAELSPGWVQSRQSYDYNRRVCFVAGEYVVVIKFVASGQARFVTAYPADGRTPRLLKEAPRWR